MGASSWVHLENCSVTQLTDKAMLVVLDDGNSRGWVDATTRGKGRRLLAALGVTP